jgi:hypothetical protein
MGNSLRGGMGWTAGVLVATMTRQQAIDRAKLACMAYRVYAYIYEDSVLGWCLRFNAPVEHTIEDGITTDIVDSTGEPVPRWAWSQYQFVTGNGNISRRKGRHV